MKTAKLKKETNFKYKIYNVMLLLLVKFTELKQIRFLKHHYHNFLRLVSENYYNLAQSKI